jgi:hypothetical protein
MFLLPLLKNWYNVSPILHILSPMSFWLLLMLCNMNYRAEDHSAERLTCVLMLIFLQVRCMYIKKAKQSVLTS